MRDRDRVEKIKNKYAILIISIVGLLVFWNGLHSPFQRDDFAQIVNNPPVHSLSNTPLFFKGSTFYTGGGLNIPLSGTYYRPLMSTAFSLLYTLFGQKTLYYHLLQLILAVTSAIFLFLFFKFSFNSYLSLVLSLIFLIHPLNSQNVYAIASLQDVLFFFFGTLALYLLVRYRSIKSLILVSLLLFLSLLSKETGALFILLASLYLFWWERERLLKFIITVTPLIIAYMVLKINAVGLSPHSNIAPIDSVNFVGRLWSLPAILFFYISKLVNIKELSSGYYWIHVSFSLRYFLIPLLTDCVVLGVIIYQANLLRKKGDNAQYKTFLFFGIWLIIGLIPYLQIIPLDMTVSETWFYFSFAGLLGLIGVSISNSRIVFDNTKLFLLFAFVLVIMGVRTAARGTDWQQPVKMAYKDISVSRENYDAYNTIAQHLMYDQSDYTAAQFYIRKSINLYPSYINYYYLGVDLTHLGNFQGAIEAYNQSLSHGNLKDIYEYLGQLQLAFSPVSQAKKTLLHGLNIYPQDSILWKYLAIAYAKDGESSKAKKAIEQAAVYGPVPGVVYDAIENNRPLKYYFTELHAGVQI